MYVHQITDIKLIAILTMLGWTKGNFSIFYKKGNYSIYFGEGRTTYLQRKDREKFIKYPNNKILKILIEENEYD